MRARFLRAHARHRLVEQQHARPRRQRHGDLELAVLAVAQVGDDDVGARRPGRRARAPRAPARAARVSLRASRQKRNEWPACACTASATLSSAVKSRNSEVIWNERASPSCAAPIDRQRGDVVAGEADAAGIGRDLAGELADQRGLAGAVRADDGVQLARAAPSSVMSSEATTPPKRLVRPSICEQRAQPRRSLSSRPSMPPRANSTTSSSIGRGRSASIRARPPRPGR